MKHSNSSRGASAVEFIAIGAGVALITAAVAPQLGAHGAPHLVSRVARAVDGAITHPERLRMHGRGERIGRRGDIGTNVARRAATNTAFGPKRNGPHWSHATYKHERGGSKGALRASEELQLCVLCAGIDTDLTTAALSTSGVGAEADARAYIALVRASAKQMVDIGTPDIGASVALEESGTIGAEADAEGELRFDRGVRKITVGAEAVAGARVRSEAEAAIRLAGIAIEATGGVEGWAGAGGAGGGTIELSNGKFVLGGKLGGAFGLGGEFDGDITIDAGRLLSKTDHSKKRYSK